MDASAGDGHITFNREVRKNVFDFFASILCNYPDPVYYEYIRGHVSKASLPVRKYVMSKCKGEKLLEYFKLRKNYFKVEGTDVLLIRDPSPKRKRVQSECATSEVIRGRKQSWKSDRASLKRSFSCSSSVSDNTVASSCVSSITTEEKMEHEDYVNTYFWNLVNRHGKVDLFSLEFDNLPKKVKRHLDLYYKRNVSNYFARFPNKYKMDDDFKVSLNLHPPEDSCVTSEIKSVGTITPPNSATTPKYETDNSPLTVTKKKSSDPYEQEIKYVIFHTEAILFFIDILTKKKTTITVQQLGGHLSQAPEELRSFLKFNYTNFKDFFEETSYIFLLNSCEEVTLSKFVRFQKSGVERIQKIAVKASIGNISMQTMRDKVEELRNKIKLLVPHNESDKNVESACEVIADNDTVQQIAENQPEPFISRKTIEAGGWEPNWLGIKVEQIEGGNGEPNCLVIKDEQIEVGSGKPNCLVIKDEQIEGGSSDPNCLDIKDEQIEVSSGKPNCLVIKDEHIEGGSGEPNCLDKKINEQIDIATFQPEMNGLAEMEFDVPIMIKRLKMDYDYYGYSTDGIVFEINGKLYEPNGKLFVADPNHYEGDLSTKETADGDTIVEVTIVKVIPRPCKKHMNYQVSNSENIMDLNSYLDCPSETFFEEKTFKFLLMVELFCLEMTEKDFDFTVSHEVKAVQYFIELLNQPIAKTWNASSLHGTLGKSSSEVSSFINKNYKVSNFLSFFQKQPEFEVYPPIIKLATSYKETFDRRIKVLSVSSSRNSKWDLLKLYESSCYKTVLTEIFSLFCEICNFLKNKSKTKLSRLEGIVTRFPNCLDWIKSLEGETVAKKTRCFLHLFDIFEFPSDDYISFQLNYYNNILMMWFQNSPQYFDCPNNQIDLVSIFVGLRNQATVSPVTGKFDVKVGQLSCNFINDAIKDKLPLKYHELARALPEHLLQEIIESGIGSRTLIETLLKDGQYFLQNGKIDLKTNENNSMDLNSAIDNSLVENREFQSHGKASNMSDEVVSETSNGSVSNNQSSEKTIPDYYNDSKSTSLFVSSINENTLCESNPINISSPTTTEKCQNDLNDCNENEFQSLDPKCVNHNSHITVSNEVKVMASNECEDLKNDPLYEDTDQTGSTASVKNGVETLNEDFVKKYPDTSFDMDRCETCNQVPHHNIIEHDEDFDSSVEEIDSLIALGERHSLSSYENEELIYSDKDNSYDSIKQEANKCFADTGYKEDNISSQFVNMPKKEIIDDKTINCNDIKENVIMEKYLELLKMDDEAIDTKQDDTSSDRNILNEAMKVSEVSFANDLNCSKTKMEIPDEPKVPDIVNNGDEFTDIINNKYITESLSEMKYKAELLAKEFFQDKFHKIVKSKIFVASTKILFECKKKYLRKAYGPFDLKSTEKNYSNSETVSNPIETPIPFQNSNSLPNLTPTADKDLNHNKDIPFKNSFQDKSVSINDTTVNTHFNLSNGKDIFVECPLQGELNSANDKENSASLSSINGNECHTDNPYLEENNFKSNENLNLSGIQSVPNEYPLQPISAEIVLLSSDSCIAVADIDSRKQNIYFLKCVFVCDDQYCCSNCFNDLKVGDIVSCFVPPTEISRKMWIAFMVSKETGSHFNEIDSFNEVFIKQNKGSGSMHHNMCVNSRNVFIQTEHSSAELGCQVENKLTDKTSQTRLCGDVKLCTITKDSMCQINSLVKSVSIQTVNEINSSECQTEIIDKIDMESQTNHTGKLKEVSTCAEMSCQTDISGEVRAKTNLVETECQTISTGQVMITKYYHL